MLKNMWNYIKNFLQRSKEVGVNKKTIIYIIETVIEYGDDADCKMKVREVRTKIKQVINENPKMKIIKIDSKVI